MYESKKEMNDTTSFSYFVGGGGGGGGGVEALYQSTCQKIILMTLSSNDTLGNTSLNWISN